MKPVPNHHIEWKGSFSINIYVKKKDEDGIERRKGRYILGAGVTTANYDHSNKYEMKSMVRMETRDKGMWN
jgi:hypothetical protein